MHVCPCRLTTSPTVHVGATARRPCCHSAASVGATAVSAPVAAIAIAPCVVAIAVPPTRPNSPHPSRRRRRATSLSRTSISSHAVVVPILHHQVQQRQRALHHVRLQLRSTARPPPLLLSPTAFRPSQLTSRRATRRGSTRRRRLARCDPSSDTTPQLTTSLKWYRVRPTSLRSSRTDWSRALRVSTDQYISGVLYYIRCASRLAAVLLQVLAVTQPFAELEDFLRRVRRTSLFEEQYDVAALGFQRNGHVLQHCLVLCVYSKVHHFDQVGARARPNT